MALRPHDGQDLPNDLMISKNIGFIDGAQGVGW